jgi:acetyl-CoA synthetase
MAESNLAAFMVRWGIPDYDTLLRRSVEEGAWFWEAVLQDLDIVFYTPYTQVMDTRDGVPFTRWCVDGQMNIVHNALDKWQATPVRDRTALRWEGEEGTEQTLTYGELHAAVGRCANALRHLGLGAGDAVGLFMPMTPELAVAFLAVIKIGGIVLPLFSGYGPGAIAARLQDAGAKALFTADGFFRRGRPVALKPVADEALAQCPTVQHVVVHRRAGLDDLPWTDGRDHAWDALVARQPAEAATVHTAAEDVLMVIYTSGTTGKPKGAVHTHCGFPVKAAQDLRQAMDLKPGEVLYWMTDMGWMMGPWLVFGALLNGATMVFTDGAPDYPTPARLWQVVERHGVTHLGVSPVLIRSLMTHGTAPLAGRDFSRLRAVGSTGSPWDPDGWQWLFQHVLEGRKPILNYSGGTEISGGILCGNFFKPLKPGAFSGPVPGMDADVVDEHGQPVRNAVGELVIRKPWIGMTRGFWHDHQRYLDAYWSRFEGLWLHGDFAAIDEDGLWYLLGRSDDTIKVAGKRVGPSEVEALLNAHPAVLDSAAIGVPHPVKDEEIAAFVILKPGHQPEEPLRQALMALVTDELGKALKPQFVKFVIALPKTRNAKVMRRVIRAAWLDLDPGDISSLEDPTTIEAIRQAR